MQELEGDFTDGRIVKDQLDDVDRRLETDGQQVFAPVLEEFGDADLVKKRDRQLRGQGLLLHLADVSKSPDSELNQILSEENFQTPRTAFEEVNKNKIKLRDQ